MIIKAFEINKIKINNYKLYLLYGENEGYKNETIKKYFEKVYLNQTFRYEEKEILENKNNFYNSILSRSFFENEKLIIISRVTDKIKDIIEEISAKQIDDVIIVLSSGILEKKSKIRNFFEKEKNTVCIPFYNDNNITLSNIASIFFKKNKIPISQQTINLIIERCRGNRENLNNELIKIENYCKFGKKISSEDIFKITNLAENYNVSELIDNCLLKNEKKIVRILNENNYSADDCILIIRTFLNKMKRLLKIQEEIISKKNVDQVITNFKPPIFWKEKEIVKQQISLWPLKKILIILIKINEIELLIKKNSNNSLNILSDFIISQSSNVNNKI